MKKLVPIDFSEYFYEIEEVLNSLKEDEEPYIIWESKVEPRFRSTFGARVAMASPRLESIGAVMLTHVFMVVNPLPGEEDTINNNLTDIWNNWLVKYYTAFIKSGHKSLSITAILGNYDSLAKQITSQLPKHGYNRKIIVDHNYTEELVLALEYVLLTLRKRYKKLTPDNSVVYDILKSELNTIPKIEVY